MIVVTLLLYEPTIDIIFILHQLKQIMSTVVKKSIKNIVHLYLLQFDTHL